MNEEDYTVSPWTFDERYDSGCGYPCTPSGCHEMHPSGVYDIDGPSGINDFGEDDVLTVRDIKDAYLITASRNMLKALESVVEIAKEAHKNWDADENMRVGKILMALARRNDGYREDITNIHAIIAKVKGED